VIGSRTPPDAPHAGSDCRPPNAQQPIVALRYLFVSRGGPTQTGSDAFDCPPSVAAAGDPHIVAGPSSAVQCLFIGPYTVSSHVRQVQVVVPRRAKKVTAGGEPQAAVPRGCE
jgi:hypothetical protein